MSRKLYKENINQLLDAIDTLLEKKMILLGLILIFTGIDIMSWLNRGKLNKDNTRKDFKIWVNCYLLPDSGINCDAEDLYAARCAILHSYTTESALSRDGAAKKIFYAWGVAPSNKLQKIIDVSSESGKTIILHVDQFNNAFKIAVKRFNLSLNKNQELSKLVSKRTDKFLAGIPNEVVEFYKI
jgi:hypothetical protein